MTTPKTAKNRGIQNFSSAFWVCKFLFVCLQHVFFFFAFVLCVFAFVSFPCFAAFWPFAGRWLFFFCSAFVPVGHRASVDFAADGRQFDFSAHTTCVHASLVCAWNWCIAVTERAVITEGQRRQRRPKYCEDGQGTETKQRERQRERAWVRCVCVCVF